MALKTQYQPYGLPGKIRTFSAKSAAAAIAIHVFGTNPHLQAPNHVADSDDNVLVMGEIEARGGASFGGVSNYSKFDSDGNLTMTGNLTATEVNIGTNWRIREATAADVSAGDAVNVGDMLFENKSTGVIRNAFELID